MDINELREYMKSGKIRFQYKKKSGELRNALGTLEMSYIEEQGMKPMNTINRPGIFTYFDIDKNEWRSCWETNIIEYEKPDAIPLELFEK